MKSRLMRVLLRVAAAAVVLAGAYAAGAAMMVGVGYLAFQHEKRARTAYRGVS